MTRLILSTISRRWAAGPSVSEKSESMSPSVRRKQRAFDSSLSMPWRRREYSYSSVLTWVGHGTVRSVYRSPS